MSTRIKVQFVDIYRLCLCLLIRSTVTVLLHTLIQIARVVVLLLLLLLVVVVVEVVEVVVVVVVVVVVLILIKSLKV